MSLIPSSTSHLLAESRLLLFILLCILAAPYTKVEESFNMQGTHDFLAHGLRLPLAEHLDAFWDHMHFPGAVPRTFVGSAALSLLSFAPLRLSNLSSPSCQLVVRAVLGGWNGLCVVAYSRALRSAAGDGAATAFLALAGCQFHLLYYAGRLLPNFLAFGGATLAAAWLLPPAPPRRAKDGTTRRMTTSTRRLQAALALLTVMGIVFRSEIAVLLACQTLALLWQRRLGPVQVVRAGAVGVLVGLGLTVPLDSAMWQRPVWPELSAFLFNVVEGKAEEWGTSPVYDYFLNSLPKLLFNPATYLVCIPVALRRDASGRAWRMLLPNLAFIAILSLQGHKEWRFIVYVLPPLTAVAAIGADQLWKNRSKPDPVQRGLLAVVLLSVPLSMAVAFAFLLISSLNYPGAAAINRFQIISSASDSAGPVHVHMDTLTCMTGVTRFLELSTPTELAGPDLVWHYDKEEDERTLLDPVFWERFDYVITESPARAIGAWKIVEPLGTVTAYSGFALTKSSTELQKQRIHADLSGDPSGQLSDLGRNLLVWWDDVGLSLLAFTSGRWLTVRMEPKLYVLKRTRGAL